MAAKVIIVMAAPPPANQIAQTCQNAGVRTACAVVADGAEISSRDAANPALRSFSSQCGVERKITRTCVTATPIISVTTVSVNPPMFQHCRDDRGSRGSGKGETGVDQSGNQPQLSRKPFLDRSQ